MYRIEYLPAVALWLAASTAHASVCDNLLGVRSHAREPVLLEVVTARDGATFESQPSGVCLGCDQIYVTAVEFTTLTCAELVNTTFWSGFAHGRSTQVFEQYVLETIHSGVPYGLYFAEHGEIAYYIPLHKLLEGNWIESGTIPILYGIDPSGMYFPADMIFYDATTGLRYTGDIVAKGLVDVFAGRGPPLPALGSLGLILGILALACTGVACRASLKARDRASTLFIGSKRSSTGRERYSTRADFSIAP